MRRLRIRTLALAGAFLLAGCGPFQKDTASQGAGTLMRQADAAREAGRIAEAAQDYQGAVEASLPTNGRLPEALYWAGLLRLSTDSAVRDLGQARRFLSRLVADWPESAYRQQAMIALALASEIEETRSQVSSLKSEASRDASIHASEKEDLSGQLSAAQADLLTTQSDLKTASDEAKTCDADNAALRKELDEKEEALRKVKEVLVGWRPKH